MFCDHCYRDAGARLDEELTTDQARNLIDGMVRAGFKIMIFSGGEPLMRPDIYELARYATDLGLEDYLGKKGITIIEWPEIGASDLPQDALIINIELVEGDYDRERMVTIQASGPEHIKLLEELTQNVPTGY